MASVAWTFRLDALTTDHASITVSVSYFDAVADPGLTNPLHSATISFSPDQPTADIKQDIVTTGQTARATIARQAALLAQFPLGTTGAVP